MNLEEIKSFLDQNKDSEDVKAFLTELKTPSLDDVKSLATENEELKNWFQSEKDRYFSKGLDTWKQNNLDRLIQEEYDKRNPPESETEKQLRELRAKFEQAEKARQREAIRNQAYKKATEKGLPVDLLDYLVSDDEESTLANLSTLEKVWESEKQKIVEQQFKQNGREPHRSQSPQPNDLKSQYDKAVKTGDQALAIALKREMAFSQNNN